MLNKVPEVTFYFWIIKVLCTTVGETAADYLNVNLNFGLTGTSIVTGILLAVALLYQFRTRKYTPITYWVTVMFISVFGTLVTNNLTDRLGVPLETSTIVFTVALAGTFLVWYFREKTLSIHSIFTTRREGFYWLAILFTFALGTASGDLMAEGLGLGYATTGIIIAGLIVLLAVGWKLRLNPVLSFWMIYIFTRPLGASIGDYLSQSPEHGGLGLGATITSFIFVGGILALVAYLTVTRADVIEKRKPEAIAEDEHRGGLWQTATVVCILVVGGLVGYEARHSALQSDSTQSLVVTAVDSSHHVASPIPPAGDFTLFSTITKGTLDIVTAGNQQGALKRIGDLEFEWDKAEARLKPKDPVRWKVIDGKIDAALRAVRASRPDFAKEKSTLEAVLKVLV